MKLNHTILSLTIILLIIKTPVYACTCVRNPKWTIKDWLNKSDVVVKGRVISVTVYKDSDFPWHYKLFKLVVEKKYKASVVVSDTMSIVTGQDGGSCGYAFKIGKKYIVYGGVHKQTNNSANLQLDNSANKPIESLNHILFETDICTPTKESNKRELAALKRLTR